MPYENYEKIKEFSAKIVEFSVYLDQILNGKS